MQEKCIWRVGKTENEKAAHLASQLGISPTAAGILINRGFDSPAKARAYLYASFNDLRDPLEIPGMKQAAERVFEAVRKSEHISIYGDYDVDGITSTALLVQLLRRLGGKVDYYIPARLDEGYGLNKQALEEIRDRGAGMVLTVDCGISAVEETEYAAQLGLDVVITDHHQPPPILPKAQALVNPKLAGEEYPWFNLAGVGVAFKLGQAVSCMFGNEKMCEEYLDLVALGTIADIVPLCGENRILVKEGLPLLRQGKRPGLAALMEVCGTAGRDITAEQAGFILAPRLNACGRLGRADLGVELLLAEDEERCREAAAFLDKENRARQNLEMRILKQAEAMVQNQVDLSEEKVIVLASEGWHPGVIGIVASRLAEKYYRPVIMISLEKGLGKGSGRSIPGFNLYEALEYGKEMLLTFGGHEMAAGLSVRQEQVPSLKETLERFAGEVLQEKDMVPVINADCEVSCQDLTPGLVEEIAMMAPFGYHNASPLLVLRARQLVNCRKVGAGGAHLKLRLLGENGWLDGIAFQKGSLKELVDSWDRCDVAFYPDINTYNGRTELQLVIKHLKSSRDRDDPFQPASFLDRLYQEGQVWLEDDFYRDVVNREEFFTKLAGVTFENRQDVIKDIQDGDSVEIRREAGNACDRHAVAVFWQGVRIGYLNSRLARNLAPALDRGVLYEAFVVRVTGCERKSLGVNICIKKTGLETDPASLEEKRRQIARLQPGEIEERIRQAVLGKNGYREKQREAIEALKAGHNSLVVFATGRGKSAVFQSVSAYFALVRRQVTVIVYPLRSLLNDQLQHLWPKMAGLGVMVEAISGAASIEEKRQFFHRMIQGNIDIVLTTPEFLAYHREKFKSVSGILGLLVVDEAHHLACGKRRGYRLLPGTWRELGSPQALAVTATAGDETGQAIVDALSCERVIVEEHTRVNLRLVDRREEKDKLAYLINLVSGGERIVIYVNSRKQAYQLAGDLRLFYPPAREEIAFYHGGLNREYRKTLEDMFRQGALRVMVTTSAFGEGIDIPDIKHVVLYHLCFSRAEFNQLAGRAGRDGAEAYIHILFGEKDKALNELILENAAPSREVLRKVYLYLREMAQKANPLQVTNAEIKEAMQAAGLKNFREQTASACLAILEELGLVLREMEGNRRQIHFAPPPPGKLDLSDSVRYLEGLGEWEEFQEFSAFALQENSEEILAAVNKPIIPGKGLRLHSR
ncbi:MAG: single-stranded-DNA-specific exonuclease RecJ [Peptococcaceae bacterium]|jgi:single-stranded-DNA-specific exonuclease|nr:single-stranded-DNA-specific exonuclease RecJ [Peptococcaceae bacterium]MDH7525129.1 single-stranded-DNA-specific exonuclease RecJ [Peptococcaceae bacterium]